MRGTTPDWKQEDFDRLAKLVLDTVSNGGTVMDGCKKFEEETNGLRTLSANRYKWVTKLSKQYSAQYEVAKAKGEQIQRQQAAERKEQIQTVNTKNVFQLKTKDDVNVKMTQRELIKFLRNIEITSEDENELRRENEKLKCDLNLVLEELQMVKRNLNTLKHQHEEVKAEYSTMLDAFNIARKNYVGVAEEKKRYVVGPNGLVEAIHEDI